MGIRIGVFGLVSIKSNASFLQHPAYQLISRYIFSGFSNEEWVSDIPAGKVAEQMRHVLVLLIIGHHLSNLIGRVGIGKPLRYTLNNCITLFSIDTFLWVFERNL